MKPKEQRKQFMTMLQRNFESSPSVIVCKFEGLTVQQDQELRRELRSTGARYCVISNRLAHLAAKDTPYEEILKNQRGMTSVTIADENTVAALKALSKYAKGNLKFTFTAGIIEGRVLDLDALNTLSTLPSREELFSKLLYLLNSSAQRVMDVLNAPVRDIAVVVQQGVRKKKFTE